MKNEFVDIKKLKKAIADTRADRDLLNKQQAKLRVRESRLKKLLKEATQ
jgi:hypothetical protein